MSQGEGDWALDLSHVAKTFRGGVQALRGIEMRVWRGEVFGLLGPNGAGKSTLIKILMTVIRPSRCEGTILGRRVGDQSVLARVGYLPEHHRFPDYLTARQLLHYVGAMGKINRKERVQRIGKLLDMVDMTDWADKKLGSFSKGMRQRVGLAQALCNDPDLVLLDEPTDGVDPVGRRDIRKIVARLRDEGKTVFLNSHLLSELEMVCERVAILLRGEVRLQGTMSELIDRRAGYRIRLGCDDDVEVGRAAVSAALPGGVEVRERELVFKTAEAKEVQPAIDALRQRGFTISHCWVHKPTLEDLFLEAVVDPETGQPMHVGAARKGKG
ncbi:MAG: ABC transporter ATP-binding protein [Leptolyngbya sp. PLA3]|nr:MAG: ABC transporter ATP-binding protein [Cyanobacteria bacterium CYA]MCE7967516.1 ABC transporter ATP-binding protein [Leptolyngbya sp. PL-A3]